MVHNGGLFTMLNHLKALLIILFLLWLPDWLVAADVAPAIAFAFAVQIHGVGAPVPLVPLDAGGTTGGSSVVQSAKTPQVQTM